MAVALGVSRQCIHVQLLKCADLHTEQLARHDLRWHHDRNVQRQLSGLAWTETHAPGGKALIDFLRAAQAHGWSVHVERRRRARINGVRLAFHMPRRMRRAPGGHHAPTRYYHFQLTRPDWLHVVYLPTGRYVFYMPDANRARGSYYIPERVADEPQTWPEWSHTMSPKRTTVPSVERPVGRRPHRVNPPAWAA
ncbi:MAG TPA: hypothetical protein VMT89_08760 [Candidatus Acidoferrales bacterium]|nr:hypothetical protein [Candidatus Acidoferrales bacterium]